MSRLEKDAIDSWSANDPTCCSVPQCPKYRHPESTVCLSHYLEMMMTDAVKPLPDFPVNEKLKGDSE